MKPDADLLWKLQTFLVLLGNHSNFWSIKKCMLKIYFKHKDFILMEIKCITGQCHNWHLFPLLISFFFFYCFSWLFAKLNLLKIDWFCKSVCNRRIAVQYSSSAGKLRNQVISSLYTSGSKNFLQYLLVHNIKGKLKKHWGHY